MAETKQRMSIFMATLLAFGIVAALVLILTVIALAYDHVQSQQPVVVHQQHTSWSNPCPGGHWQASAYSPGGGYCVMPDPYAP